MIVMMVAEELQNGVVAENEEVLESVKIIETCV